MTQPGGDPLALLESALQQATRVTGAVTPEQMGLPTPCDEWDVRELLAHMHAALPRYIAMVSGVPAGAGASTSTPDAQEYGAQAQALLAAWRRPGALEQTYQMPFGSFPGPAFVGITVMETVIHTWDLAKATGQTDALDPRLAEASLGTAMRAVPAERSSAQPFKPVVAVPSEAPAYDRLAGYVGRQP